MPTWPATLPHYLSAEQYRERPPWPTAEVEMDAGPPKVFGTGTDGPRIFDCQVDLDSEQRQTLDDFYLVDLRQGTVEFDGLELRDSSATRLAFVVRPTVTHVTGDIYTMRMVLESRGADLVMGFRGRSSSRGTFNTVTGPTMSFRCETGSHGDFDFEEA